jgi:endoglucanase
VVTHDGKITVRSAGAGFSAALIPYFGALEESRLKSEQERRLRSHWNRSTGLYGGNPRYYDQNLALFSTGWTEGRYCFAADGRLDLRCSQPGGAAPPR